MSDAAQECQCRRKRGRPAHTHLASGLQASGAVRQLIPAVSGRQGSGHRCRQPQETGRGVAAVEGRSDG